MKKLITVFTPTLNRAGCIHRCYYSLCRQLSFNFEWLIIDDGSTDNTCNLVKKWQEEQKKFSIRYYWKENGGLHSAYNKGIELTNTELFVCIDSDDWMPNDAISKIEKIWEQTGKLGYVGIMGIDCYEDGYCVGDPFPDKVHEMYLYEKMIRYRLKGDKKMVHRSDLLKKVAPMPTFGDEKYFNPSYLMYQLDQYGKLYVTNECLCVVDYQPDGMSSNIYKQYRDSPNSFAATRKLYLTFPGGSWGFRFRQYIHYDSSCILSHRLLRGIEEAADKKMALAAIVPGYFLTAIVLYKSK